MTLSRRTDVPICFTTREFFSLFQEPERTLKGRIEQALKKNRFLSLKKGLYLLSDTYLHEPDKTQLTEYIASQIYSPSYLSLEYILEKHGLLLPSQNRPITCITTKTTRTFTNLISTFTYSNIKSAVFFDFEERTYQGQIYHVATKAKALFDYLYLKSDMPRRNEKRLKHWLTQESGIQWANFSQEDCKDFNRYVWKSNSFKMMKILRILDQHVNKEKSDRDFDAWAKQLLGK